jgi:hypothetical protein
MMFHYLLLVLIVDDVCIYCCSHLRYCYSCCYSCDDVTCVLMLFITLHC